VGLDLRWFAANAISRSNWSPESAEVRPFLGRSLAEVVPGSARSWIAVNAVHKLNNKKRKQI
jgi:hypothetical protein